MANERKRLRNRRALVTCAGLLAFAGLCTVLLFAGAASMSKSSPAKKKVKTVATVAVDSGLKYLAGDLFAPGRQE